MASSLGRLLGRIAGLVAVVVGVAALTWIAMRVLGVITLGNLLADLALARLDARAR